MGAWVRRCLESAPQKKSWFTLGWMDAITGLRRRGSQPLRDTAELPGFFLSGTKRLLPQHRLHARYFSAQTHTQILIDNTASAGTIPAKIPGDGRVLSSSSRWFNRWYVRMYLHTLKKKKNQKKIQVSLLFTRESKNGFFGFFLKSG